MLISKIFKFDSAHKIPNYKGKCAKLHGHTWKLIVTFKGEVDQKTGMIMDFVDIKKIVEEKILDKLDHLYLNDIIENPTCENILLWIKEQLKEYRKINRLILYESENSFCELEC